MCIIILLNRPLTGKPLNVTHYKHVIKFKLETCSKKEVCNIQIVCDPESLWSVFYCLTTKFFNCF